MTRCWVYVALLIHEDSQIALPLLPNRDRAGTAIHRPVYPKIGEGVTASSRESPTLSAHESTSLADTPFFLWWNSTRMHVWTRLKPQSQLAASRSTRYRSSCRRDPPVGN